jgi:predicted TIM-barrel fold metal-dependent hydrolase
MTDVRTEARRRVKQEDREGIEERIAYAAEQMAEDVRVARVRDAVAKQRIALLAAHAQTKQSILQTAGGTMVAVRTLVDGLREMSALYGTLRKQATELREEVPPSWSPYDVAVRFGFRVAAELSKISGMHTKFGSVTWSLHGSYPADADWVSDEKKILAMRDVNNDDADKNSDEG